MPGKMWMGGGGALMVDRPITGSQELKDPENQRFYGGRFFCGETITETMGREIARAMGFEFITGKESDNG
jgi:hypothetical protein